MRTERAFIAERPLAEHCSELVKPGFDPAQLLPSLSRMGERLARQLADALALLLGGAPTMRCLPLRTGMIADIRDAAEPLAAHSLYAIGVDAPPLLIAIDAAPVFRIVDRAFGGKGVAPRPLPQMFPLAAELMITRLETMLAAQITGAIAAATDAMPIAAVIVPQRRDGSLASLAPYPETLPLAILAIEVEEADAPVWTLTLALPIAALPALFGGDPGTRPNVSAAHPTSALAAPVADVPLTLTAVIVDMLLPFTTIAALTPGQVLPVTVARSIPLRAGHVVIAHGTIGAVDEHVAIQLTSVFTL